MSSCQQNTNESSWIYKKTYAYLRYLPRPAVSIFSSRTDSFTILCQYHGFMKLAQKTVIFWSVSSKIRLPALKRFAIFVRKKTLCTMRFLQTCKKTFFWVSKSVKPQHFFFFQFLGIFRKSEETKTQFSFSNCKNSQICASKKKVFFRFYHSTSTFAKLAWNCPQFHGSFTETDLKLKKRPEFHWNWVPKICRFWHEIS